MGNRNLSMWSIITFLFLVQGQYDDEANSWDERFKVPLDFEVLVFKLASLNVQNFGVLKIHSGE